MRGRPLSRIRITNAVLIALLAAPVAFPVASGHDEAPSPPASEATAASEVPVSNETPVASAVPISGERATVIVYYQEPNKLLGGLWPDTDLIVSGQEVAKLSKNSRVRLSVAPGHHAFWAKKPEDKIEIDLEPGRVYYLRVNWIPTAMSAYPRFDGVCPEVGAAEASLERLQTVRAIRKTTVVEAAPAPEAIAQTSEGEALVTVYFPLRAASGGSVMDAVAGGAWANVSLHVDAGEHGELQEGTYLQLRVPAGLRKFYADEPKDAFELPVEPGGRYFMRVNLVMGNFKGHGQFRVVPAAQAMAELQERAPRYVPGYSRRPPVVPPDQVSWPERQASATPLAASDTPAVITFYYPHEDLSRGRRHLGDAVLSIDGREVVKVTVGSVIRIELEPGSHHFAAGRAKKPMGFDLDLGPGEEQFLRLDGDGPFYPVCREQGSSEIQGRMKAMPTKKLQRPAGAG